MFNAIKLIFLLVELFTYFCLKQHSAYQVSSVIPNSEKEMVASNPVDRAR